MRRVPIVVALLAAGGCGGGDGETTTETVTATAQPTAATPPSLPSPLPPDGTLPVGRFNAYTEGTDEPWVRDVAAVAGAFVGAGATEASRRSLEATSRDEGATATATLILDGLLDDSVRARRYDFELERRSDGSWEVVAASWGQRCREGRGHQTFEPRPCT